MQVDILIVSCAKHFPWLRYSLKSIVRFAKGFRQVKILVPVEDLSEMSPILTELSTDVGISIRVAAFEDWHGKGFLRHEHVIMCSDEYTDADFIFHMDSDVLFVEPTTPSDYFENDKPVLLYASYHWLVTTQQANLGMWKDAVEKAIGGNSVNEFMRRPQAIHYRQTYEQARDIMKMHTGKSCEDYIRSCVNSFPQTFCEFNTLGEIAWRYLHEGYCWKNQELGEFPKPHKVVQFWSHAPPNAPQKPYYKDAPFECTPESLLKIV